MSAVKSSLLSVIPSSELEFYGPFTSVQPSTIKLKNISTDRVTFKVKTTVPKRYCVRPSCGIIEPDQSTDVIVMLQPFDFEPSEKNKHKFMIQAMPLSFDNEVNLEQLWKEASTQNISDIRLKCALRLPDELLKVEPNELVFEGVTSESSSIMVTMFNVCTRDVYFKVKTNAQKRYIVYPNEGVVKPKESKQMRVSTIPNNEQDAESRDKIVLLSVAPQSSSHEDIDQIWQIEKSRICEKVLLCSMRNQTQVDIGPSLSSTKALENEIAQLRMENSKLRESQQRLLRLGAENIPLTNASGESAGIMRLGQIPPILYLLVTFLIALFVGKFVL